MYLFERGLVDYGKGAVADDLDAVVDEVERTNHLDRITDKICKRHTQPEKKLNLPVLSFLPDHVSGMHRLSL